MSLQSGDWREELDAVDERIVDGYQSGFPVVERPFDVVAADLEAAAGDGRAAEGDGGAGGDGDAAAGEVTGAEVRERVRRLLDAGILRRFGPVLNPPVIGASTLAAVKAPADRFDEVAAVVNEYRQVNHNYARDHEWNMWFVVTAATPERRQEILDEIAERTGLAVLDLPMLTDYYIDLEFPVVNADRFARESLEATDVEATTIHEGATASLSALERRLLLAIQDGLPVTETPYADVAAEIDATAAAVVDGIDRLLASGCIKRVGCVVDHVATGFDANCMVVWDVPDDELDERGAAAGQLPYVTLCYHRPRRPGQDWPYNLFTMVHGREASAVEAKIDELAADHLPFDHDRLPSTATLKQTGAQYEALVEDGIL